MRRILYFLIIGLLCLAAIAFTETKVFICVSTTARVYHIKRKCRGLDACTHKIEEVTEADAKNFYKQRACKVCL